MPIASGALDWPESYYSRPEGAGGLSGGQGRFNRWAWMRPGHNTETHDNVSGHHGNIPSQHEHYNDGHLINKDGRLVNQNGKMKSNSSNNKNKWKEKTEDKRKEREEEKKKNRKRRRKCCCLAFWLAVLCLLLAALVLVLVFWLHPVANENGHHVDCKGKWRRNFLAYNVTNKNSTKPTYVCCYHVNQQAWDDVIAKGDKWPQGYLINETDCQRIGQCSDEFSYVECAAGNSCRPSATPFVICLFVFLMTGW